MGDSVTRLADRLYKVWLAVLLAVLVLATFSRAVKNGFVFDDGQYLLQNPAVQNGLTSRAVRWAFVSMKETANWHPVTWLSHLLDVSLYGLQNASGHHLTSILIHTANVLLLFLLLSRMTGLVWCSAFVAALFGVHPLRVESVAWIAERKDVLSTFFAMLTLWAYLGFAESATSAPSVRMKWYSLVVVLFAVGLMCKPMIVTLPFLMLLLDYWPLARVRAHIVFSSMGNERRLARSEAWNQSGTTDIQADCRDSSCGTSLVRLVLEKTPLFFLCAASSFITIIAQHKGGAIPSLARFPIDVRITNAAVSYVVYIGKMLWPRGLAAFYTHGKWPFFSWQFVGAVVILVLVSLIVWVNRGRHPYALVGWLWYIGSLVPVIGIVQVGGQGFADRYTYIPSVGLFIAMTWSIRELTFVRSKRKYDVCGYCISGVIAIAAMMVCTWTQTGYWRDEMRLFTRAIAVTRLNSLAHVNLGRALAERGELDRAILHYRRALDISPHYLISHVNLGYALVSKGKLEEGKRHYLEALKLDPLCAEAHNNLGVALIAEGDLGGAIREFEQAVRLKPDYGPAVRNLRRAVELRKKWKPGSSSSLRGVALRLAEQGRLDEALNCLTKAVQSHGSDATLWNDMGLLLTRKGQLDEAVKCFMNALKLRPDYSAAHGNFALTLYLKGDFASCRKHVQLCRKYGGVPPQELVDALSKKQAR